MQEVGVHHGRHPGAGLTGPPQILDVVAPDEEIGAYRADAFHQFAGHQHPVEGNDHVGDDSVDLGILEIIEGAQHRGGTRQPDRETEFVGTLFGQHRRSPEIELAAVGQQLIEALGGRQTVIVHHPGQLGAGVVGPLQSGVESAGPARVDRQRPILHARLGCAELGEPFAGAIGGSIVDHQDGVECAQGAQPGEQPLQ